MFAHLPIGRLLEWDSENILTFPLLRGRGFLNTVK